MQCILSSKTDIYFHLAAEEFLLKNSMEDICMLWQSDNAVVVGKHQNAMGEANYLWCVEKGIPVARRLSGGGTVFHGRGNLNFTFIRNGEKGKLVDFKRFVQPVVEYLRLLGVQAEIGTRNDILIQGLKISGNAEHVYKSRVLHHGTLLFDADLSKLNKSIKVPAGKYTSKAVKSVRSQVTNIMEFLPQKMDFKEFKAGLFNYILNTGGAGEYKFNKAEIVSIEKLVNEKYRTWDWIYAYSPKFTLETKISLQSEILVISLMIEKGRIAECTIAGTKNNILAHQIVEVLRGVRYDPQAMAAKLEELDLPGLNTTAFSLIFF